MSVDTMRRYLAAILVHVALIVLWYVFVKYGHVPYFVMPTPVATVATLCGPNYRWIGNTRSRQPRSSAAISSRWWSASRWRWCSPGRARPSPRSCRSWSASTWSPRWRSVPLFIVWFSYGIMPNTIIAFSICFFPILLTTARGFHEVEPELLDLVRSLRSSRWQIFTKIQLPSALPYIFSGMKVGGDPRGGRRHRRRVPRLRRAASAI